MKKKEFTCIVLIKKSDLNTLVAQNDESSTFMITNLERIRVIIKQNQPLLASIKLHSRKSCSGNNVERRNA